MAASPTKDLAYVTYGNANKVQAVNTASYATIGVIDMPKYNTGTQKDVIFSPDGRYAFVLNHKDSYKDIEGVNVIDAAKNEVIKIFNSGEVLRGITVTSDGSRVYVASADLKWYDMNTLEHIRSISLRTTIGDIVVVD
jgi:DNA-binding beta-propeller fold protein YncE